MAVAFEELSPDAPSIGPQLEDAIEHIQDWVCRYDWTEALRLWEDFHNTPSDSEDPTKNRRLSPLGGDITFRVTCKVRAAAKGVNHDPHKTFSDRAQRLNRIHQKS